MALCYMQLSPFECKGNFVHQDVPSPPPSIHPLNSSAKGLIWQLDKYGGLVNFIMFHVHAFKNIYIM